MPKHSNSEQVKCIRSGDSTDDISFDTKLIELEAVEKFSICVVYAVDKVEGACIEACLLYTSDAADE